MLTGVRPVEATQHAWTFCLFAGAGPIRWLLSRSAVLAGYSLGQICEE